LRVLVIVSRPVDAPALDSVRERNAILDSLKAAQESGLFEIHFLWPPTHDRLVEVLANCEYHAVHFDGHGSLLKGSACLLFETEYCEKDFIDAETFANSLSNTSTRLVVLSACQSAAINNASPLSSVAPALSAAGIPAVVAMQFPITLKSATTFSRHFYSAISRFNAVDDAVLQGRKALFPTKDEWFIPVLYRASSAGPLFKQQNAAGRPEAPAAAVCRRFGGIPDATHFVGRGEELARLSRAVAEGPNCVVIWGPGGIGKTSLAAEYVRRQDWRYPDGVLWFSMAGGGAVDIIVDATLAFFTGRPAPAMPRKEKTAEAIRILNHANALLVIDNFEDVEQDGEMCSFIDSIRSRARVLLTSRSHPGIVGWQAVQLYKLSADVFLWLYLELASEMAASVMAPQDPSEIRELCEILDGHPLALRLIIPLLVTTPLRSIIAELRTHGVQGVEASLNTSYHAVGNSEQALLMRMSVISQTFDERAIAGICRLEDWRQAKDVLVRRSLLHFDGERFAIHPVVRQYAYQKLDDPKRWHKVAAEFFESTRDYFPLVDQLYYAEDWTEVVGVMHQLSAPLFMRGLPAMGELVRRMDLLERAAKATGDARTEAMVSGDLGNILAQVGDFDGALRQYRRGYEYGKRTDDFHFQSVGLSFMGKAYGALRDHDKAIECLEESVRLCRRHETRQGLGLALSSLGDGYFMGLMGLKEDGGEAERTRQERLLDRAVEVYKEAIDVLGKEGDSAKQANPITNLGSIYAMRKEYQEATKYLEHSVKMKLELGDIYGLVASLNSLVNVCVDTGDTERGLVHANAMVMLHERGVMRGQFSSRAYGARGKIRFMMGDKDSAIGDYILSTVVSLEYGPDSVMSAVEDIEKQADDLCKRGEIDDAKLLLDVVLQFWDDKGIGSAMPDQRERLEKKRQAVGRGERGSR
jgi:tetratricopeptide (TPR) repeat protein